MAAPKLTPMMKQYLEAKSAHPDCILFFRMGDFYELFMDDARLAAEELELTLTSRDKCDEEDRVPMAGFPHHQKDNYVSRLLERGYKVAICDQMEDPAQAKGIVRREVTRIITPGVVIDPDSLDNRSNNYLAAIWINEPSVSKASKAALNGGSPYPSPSTSTPPPPSPFSAPSSHANTNTSVNTTQADMEQFDESYFFRGSARFGLAYADISTGEFGATVIPSLNLLRNELQRLEPKQLLLADTPYATRLGTLLERRETETPSFLTATRFRTQGPNTDNTRATSGNGPGGDDMAPPGNATPAGTTGDTADTTAPPSLPAAPHTGGGWQNNRDESPNKNRERGQNGWLLENRADTFDRGRILKLLGKHGLGVSDTSGVEAKHTSSLDAIYRFGFEAPDCAVMAAGAVLSYIEDTQRSVGKHMMKVRPYGVGETMILDEAARSHLELTKTLLGGRRAGSLLGLLDITCTSMGSRTMRNWITYPLLNQAAIERRLDGVGDLVGKPILREKLTATLKQLGDIQRLAGKVSSSIATPRDLKGLAASMGRLPELKAALEADATATALTELATSLDPCTDVVALLDRALDEAPPLSPKDGGAIKPGYSAELDELVSLSRDGKEIIASMESRERQATGIPNLKVRYNKVFGYYFEVTKSYLHMVPQDRYIRKQTLANAERYYTPELKEFEEKVLSADDKRAALESELFDALCAAVEEHLPRITEAGRLIATLDVFVALASIAHHRNYVRPLINQSGHLRIVEGRHPVVETMLRDEPFIPNDIDLDSEQHSLAIITGPNMAGKSTAMRQVALIVLMAQMGGFVPAKEAEIGLVDRIFTRVGAADDLTRGQSTFMVEMTETANILANATPRSLIILDEIGRGTSTFDGLSIAWAVAEHIHDQLNARTLFATHYHELTELAIIKPRVKNLSVAVKEWQDQILFLRSLNEGPANRSYGIQVARLAGLPEPVVERSKEILANLEAEQIGLDCKPVLARAKGGGHWDAGSGNGSRTGRTDVKHTRGVADKDSQSQSKSQSQLNLFAIQVVREPSPVEEELKSLDLNNITPIQAINMVHRWKSQLK